MRHLLLFLFLLTTIIIHAQLPVKTIPGFFINDVMINSEYNKASSSGNTVALKKGGSHQFNLFDLQKVVITQIDKGMPGISLDHRYLFDNNTFVARRNEKGESRWAWEIKSAGIVSDTIVRRLAVDYYALDMDDKSNFIATKIWYDSVRWHLSGMKGLYKIDRLSGKVLQTLREDTLFTCTDVYNGCRIPTFYLQKNYMVVSSKTYSQAIDILPFGDNRKITIAAHDYNSIRTDSLFLFTIGDSTLSYMRVKAFDTRTGQLVAKKWYTRGPHTTFQFECSRNKIYCFNPEEGKIYEETVAKDTISTTKSWDLASLMGLSKNQYWGFAIAKGPAFFVMPLSLSKGEAGGVAANIAHVLQGSSGKITLRVYPFYNRTPNDVAMQEKAMREQKAFVDQIEKERDSIAHPEKFCSQRWGMPKYRRGLTIFWGDAYMIMADYDCKADKYKLWRPQQQYNGNGHIMEPQYVMVSGSEFREGNYSTNKYWTTCSECDGDGRYEVTVYTTKTKDLPWGYFSGIETKKITTKATTSTRICLQCHGQGVVLNQ